MSGLAAGKIACVGVITPILLGYVFSFGTGAVEPINVGNVPAVPPCGVTGILKVVSPTGAKSPVFGFVQLTVCPDVIQFQPF